MKASFRLKAGIMLWVAWVIVAGYLSFASYLSDRRLQESHQARVTEIYFAHGKVLAGQYASDVKRKDAQSIRKAFKDLLAHDPEVVEVAVWLKPEADHEPFVEEERENFSGEASDYTTLIEDEDVKGKVIGKLNLRVRESQGSPHGEGFLWEMARPVVVAALLGLALLLLVDVRLRRILGRLIQSTRRMAAGDLSQRIEIDTHDELEELGDAFNRMARNLAESEEELRQANEKLARRVEERTRELSKSEIRYKNLVDSSGDAIVTTDLHGKITFVNRSAEEVFGYFGYGEDEMLGVPIYQLYEAGRPEAKEIMAALAAGATVRNREIRVVGKDGGRSVISMSASILRDEWGGPIGTLGVAKDISELKTLQKRLIHTERLAAIGKMSAKIAHEIRNPLGSLSLNAEMLDEEIVESNGASDETRQLVKAMAREIDRLAAITEEYLEFSRVPTPSPTPVDIGEQIETLVGFMSKEFAERGVTACLDLESGAGPAMVDRRQMRQCLINLVRNALEAMGGSGRIGLSVLDAGDAVEVRIEDSGPGIAEEERERIFEPFYTTKTGGTGLGLAICGEIVAGHGGEIRIRQSQFGGAAFCLKLPKIPVQSGEVGTLREDRQ